MWIWVLKPLIGIVLFINGIAAIIKLPSNWETVNPLLTQIYSDPTRFFIVIASFGFIVWLYWPQIKSLRNKSKTEKSPAPRESDDLYGIWLSEAIIYAGFLDWDYETDALTRPSDITKTYEGTKKVIQVARDGKLVVYGRSGFAGPLEPIASEYWGKFGINALDVLSKPPHDLTTKLERGAWGNYGVKRNLRTSKRNIEELWPPRKENVKEKQELLEKLRQLRKVGVAHRNKPILKTEYQTWDVEFRSWRESVLENANKLSISLHAILETCDKTEQSPQGLSTPVNDDHELNRRIITTICYRLQKYFEEHA